jgi:arylsulfatase A-like enzyme
MYWHFTAYLQSYQVWNEQRDPLFRSRPCSIIRIGDWKLHQYFEDGGLELYNLRDDIGETRNLAATRADRTQQLLRQLETWRRQLAAPVPTELNPQYDPEAAAQAMAAKSQESRNHIE